MKRRTNRSSLPAKRPLAFGLVLAAALAVAALVGALVIGGPAPTPNASAHEAGQPPATDDVPDAGAPPGEVRPGTTSGAPPGPSPVRVVPDQLLVKFEEGTPPGVVRRVLARAGVTPERRIDHTGARTVEVAPAERAAALAELDASAAVEYAETDVVLTALDTVPNDAQWPGQWGPSKVSAPRAWDAARGSANVIVAVLDTGVDFGHPDLRGAAVPGYDFVGNDGEPADDHGHGTAAAGVLAARTNNIEGLAGVCWSCALMSVKVLDATGSGNTSTIAQGIVWAVDHGADVINLSLGGPGSQTLGLAAAYAASKGVLLVAAAGNSGVSTPMYPAALPEVVSVAATDQADQRYSWSNFGPWVQVAAPGCNIAPLRGGGYGNFCGTSSATPVVAGLAGLALSAKPTATRAELEHAIRSAVVPVSAGVQYGRVDGARTLSALAVQFPAPQPPAPPPPPTASPTPVPVVATNVRGRVTGARPTWVVARRVGSGRMTATLAFGGASRLALSVVNRTGTTIRRVAGASPLRAAVAARAGTYKFVVRGGRAATARFTLRLSYRTP